jgi:translin
LTRVDASGVCSRQINLTTGDEEENHHMDERPRDPASTDDISQSVSEIIERFDAMSTARDSAVTNSRQVVRLSANAIRALHRGDNASGLLEDARGLLDSIREESAPYPSVYWAGYVQDAMKEYAEAEITAALLGGTPIPDATALHVEDAAWLNGLAEAASELRRDTLDALRGDNTARAEDLLAQMDAIYSVLVTVDFPDAVTGGLRRTTDQFRGVLERTRGDVSMSVRQSRLEHALREAESRRDSQ